MPILVQVPNPANLSSHVLLGKGLMGQQNVGYCCIPQPQGPETHYHNVDVV